MKIAFRGGHNEQATGASALIDELTEDRKVLAECINVARGYGHEVLDCTPGPCDVNTDLVYGVKKANEWGADIYIPIHFDKAYDNYNGALGTGTFVYSKSDAYKDEDIAQKISNNIAALGFKNRGVKEADYYDLRMTTMPAVLVEVCFCEATEDVALYRKLGARKIAEAIVSGITGKNIEQSVQSDIGMRVALDEPNHITIDSNKLKVRGWALNHTKLEILIDNVSYGTVETGQKREDVYEAYPQYNNHFAGYEKTLEFTELEKGQHKCTVRATDNNNKTIEVKKTFTASKSISNDNEVLKKENEILRKENKELKEKMSKIKNIVE
ncbi:N-acetylmuramoyl-L-alanine amidase [Clostridium septicum]|uniref:N-acetylmuramoyl-L-alanine amidase n=1 Tax=Clostridium septicum TaxID=1504 RepID=UPI000834B44E|nr:N-acetylmuramoyl-L-alanine amidase [Clostridium septicum]WLF70904.1 N-acetylmuramoyl-L-alanine amidase [Clostridium septicum]